MTHKGNIWNCREDLREIIGQTASRLWEEMGILEILFIKTTINIQAFKQKMDIPTEKVGTLIYLHILDRLSNKSINTIKKVTKNKLVVDWKCLILNTFLRI